MWSNSNPLDAAAGTGSFVTEHVMRYCGVVVYGREKENH
jgi:hypothetical protein